MKFLRPLLFLLCLLLASRTALAHEVRPAYLELRETSPDEFAVLWKTPMVGDARLALYPEFPPGATNVSPVVAQTPGNAAIQTWNLRAPSLRGGTLRIRGLDSTMTDVLVRIEFADGTSWTQRLTPHQPAALIPQSQSALSVAVVYLKLGVEHILTGVDHLLFVLALLIITRGGWKMVKTVTAFTLSHSVTLSLATLGYIHVPQAPVEAIIALSIVFVASEILHIRAGKPSITQRAPWLVAFIFGLGHGLGFASGMSEAGLPPTHIPTALLFFSIGVESGHFLFIGVVLTLFLAIRRTRLRLPRWAPLVPPYAIGAIAMFWVIQRIAAF